VSVLHLSGFAVDVMTQPQQQLPSLGVVEPPSGGGGTETTASNLPIHPSVVEESRSLRNGHASSAPWQQHQQYALEGVSSSSATETSQQQAAAAGISYQPHDAPGLSGELSSAAGPEGLPAIPASMRLVRAVSLPVPSHNHNNKALSSVSAAYPGAAGAAATSRNDPSETSFHSIDRTSAAAAAAVAGPAVAVPCGGGESSPRSSSESSIEAAASAGAQAPIVSAATASSLPGAAGPSHPLPASGEASGIDAEPDVPTTGAATAVDGAGVQVVQRKGRFTLLKPSAQAPAAGSTAAPAAPAPESPLASAGDSVPAAGGATTSQVPPLEDAGHAAVEPHVAKEPANVTKRKGRFTLTQETSAAPLTIVVDRAPGPPPSAMHHPPGHPDRERASSAASAAVSSISASIAAAEHGPVAPASTAAEAAPAHATAPAATAPFTAAASSSLASNSSVRTVKKMGRFVVSSVSGIDPQTSSSSAASATAAPASASQLGHHAVPSASDTVASATAPPAQPQDPINYPPSVISDSGVPIHPGSTTGAPVAQSGGHGIPREVVTVVDPSLAQSGHQPLPPPALPISSQPVLYALVPANVQLPSQPGIASGSGHSAQSSSAAPGSHADNLGPAPIRPVLSSGNLAAAHLAAVRQDAYVHAHPATSARILARESESVPAPAADTDVPRPKEVPTASASQPPPSASGPTARNHNARGYTGRQGVGKMFHYLDQLRLEATDAERTIKNLQTDVRLLVRSSYLRANNSDVVQPNSSLTRVLNINHYRRKRIRSSRPQPETRKGS
jgi:hypothetical protein